MPFEQLEFTKEEGLGLEIDYLDVKLDEEVEQIRAEVITSLGKVRRKVRRVQVSGSGRIFTEAGILIAPTVSLQKEGFQRKAAKKTTDAILAAGIEPIRELVALSGCNPVPLFWLKDVKMHLRRKLDNGRAIINGRVGVDTLDLMRERGFPQRCHDTHSKVIAALKAKRIDLNSMIVEGVKGHAIAQKKDLYWLDKISQHIPYKVEQDGKLSGRKGSTHICVENYLRNKGMKPHEREKYMNRIREARIIPEMGIVGWYEGEFVPIHKWSKVRGYLPQFLKHGETQYMNTDVLNVYRFFGKTKSKSAIAKTLMPKVKKELEEVTETEFFSTSGQVRKRVPVYKKWEVLAIAMRIGWISEDSPLSTPHIRKLIEKLYEEGKDPSGSIRRIAAMQLIDIYHTHPDPEIKKRIEEMFIASNAPWVRKTAKMYYGIPFDDRVQEGNIGVIVALRKFDTSSGNRFLPYAKHWIRAKIQRAIVAQARTIRKPEHIEGLLNRLSKATREYENENDQKEPNNAKLAEKMGVEIRTVIMLKRELQHNKEAISLESPVSKKNGEKRIKKNMIEDKHILNPEEAMIQRQEEAGIDTDVEKVGKENAVRKALQTLGNDEIAILTLKFGLEDIMLKTNAEIAAKLRIGEQKVSRLLASSIGKLRENTQLLSILMKKSAESKSNRPCRLTPYSTTNSNT